MGFRIGIGHDTHRLGAQRPLIIGGVEIPHSSGLIGHSDADVFLHALTDALLGAAGKGDIGEWFPDNDPAHLNRDSREFVLDVYRNALPPGCKIANIDGTIFAQEPKLSPYKQAIRESVAAILEISPDLVNVKAKTGERVGAIGRKEAIGAQVAVLLEWPV